MVARPQVRKFQHLSYSTANIRGTFGAFAVIPSSLKASKLLKDKAKLYFLLCSSPGLLPLIEYTH